MSSFLSTILFSVIELFMQWTPVVDFIDLFDQPVFLMADGQVPSIPVLMVSKEFDW